MMQVGVGSQRFRQRIVEVLYGVVLPIASQRSLAESFLDDRDLGAAMIFVTDVLRLHTQEFKDGGKRAFCNSLGSATEPCILLARKLFRGFLIRIVILFCPLLFLLLGNIFVGENPVGHAERYQLHIPVIVQLMISLGHQMKFTRTVCR